MARYLGEFKLVPINNVEYLDIDPSQILGISASLIPFIEHDDANRALMGSNMQRQAVPLLRTEPPLVGTGMERSVAINSGMVVRARRGGTIEYVDGANSETSCTTDALTGIDNLFHEEVDCLEATSVVFRSPCISPLMRVSTLLKQTVVTPLNFFR